MAVGDSTSWGGSIYLSVDGSIYVSINGGRHFPKSPRYFLTRYALRSLYCTPCPPAHHCDPLMTLPWILHSQIGDRLIQHRIDDRRHPTRPLELVGRDRTEISTAAGQPQLMQPTHQPRSRLLLENSSSLAVQLVAQCDRQQIFYTPETSLTHGRILKTLMDTNSSRGQALFQNLLAINVASFTWWTNFDKP